MGGLAVLFIMFAYFVLTIFIMIKTPKAWGKVLVLVVAFLIPTADAMWGRYVVMPRLCKDAGLKVFRHASKADGLIISSMTSRVLCQDLRGKPSRTVCWSGESFLIEKGISFVESKRPNGNYSRLSMLGAGFSFEENVTPVARYEYQHNKKVDTGIRNKKYEGWEDRVFDRKNGEVISRFRTYLYAGGGVEQFLGRFSDSGPSWIKCKQVSKTAGLYADVIHETFNPRQK